MSVNLTSLAVSGSYSSTNKSPAKITYSFPKSQRFAESYKPNCEKIYDMPKSKGNGAVFGSGKRYDFTNQQHQRSIPGPNLYSVENIFDQMKKQNKGFSLGVGREKVPECELVKINKFPGPGSYNDKYDKYSSAQFTMASKYSLKILHKNQNKFSEQEKVDSLYTPGPGAYSPPSTLQKAGRYVVAKYENVRGTVMAQPVSKKIEAIKQISMPGPGAYNPSDCKRTDGKLIFHEAKFKSFQGVTFGTSRPNSITKQQGPGPGAYSTPSEFGIPLEALPTYKNNRLRAKSLQK